MPEYPEVSRGLGEGRRLSLTKKRFGRTLGGLKSLPLRDPELQYKYLWSTRPELALLSQQAQVHHQSIAKSIISFALQGLSHEDKRRQWEQLIRKTGSRGMRWRKGCKGQLRATVDNASHPLYKTVDNLLQQETDPNSPLQGAIQEAVPTEKIYFYSNTTLYFPVGSTKCQIYAFINF